MGYAPLSGAERLLWDSVERARRNQSGLLALVLHLSRLAPPAPRPYHVRIARVLLQDTAARFGGQVFAMRNDDLVLLTPQDRVPVPNAAAEEGAGVLVHAPEVLPATLARLFSADIGQDLRLTSLLRLDQDTDALMAYLSVCALVAAPTRTGTPPCDAALSLIALENVLDHAPLGELLAVRTGMRLRAGRQLSVAQRLEPAFRSLELSLSALNLSSLVQQATSDPYLDHYLARRMDDHLIGLLADDLARSGKLTRQAARTGLPIHVPLGPAALLSPGFATLAKEGAKVGLCFRATVELTQVMAELGQLADIVRLLALSGSILVVSQVQPWQLSILKPSLLRSAMLELTWSDVLLAQQRGDAETNLVGSLIALDPARLILTGVDAPRALEWGQARGIALFEGAFLDQVQAVGRMGVCDHAAGCTVRQCCERARAVGGWRRAGCRDTRLLETDDIQQRQAGLAA